VKYQGNEVSLAQADANHWVSKYLYGYDTAAGQYRQLDPASGVFSAWAGYWVLAYVDCEICVAPVPAPPSPPSGALLEVSELRARGIPVPPAPPVFTQEAEALLGGLEVRNEPNPIRSEHTTTFRLMGESAGLVEAMRVDIYDLGGNLVFTEEAAGKEIPWHTVNAAGELVANGAYLYQVWAKIGGTWYPTGVRKLAVYR